MSTEPTPPAGQPPDIKPDNYYQNAREEVLAFLPPHPATVLDVGCGQGQFGANVRQRLGSAVWGIELEADPQTRRNRREGARTRGFQAE